METKQINPFTIDSSNSKIDKFPEITHWVKLKIEIENQQHHRTVLLNSFPMNGNTLAFCPSIKSWITLFHPVSQSGSQTG